MRRTERLFAAISGRFEEIDSELDALTTLRDKPAGYEDQLTGHGIRATISTALNELGYPKKWGDTDNDSFKRFLLETSFNLTRRPPSGGGRGGHAGDGGNPRP